MFSGQRDVSEVAGNMRKLIGYLDAIYNTTAAIEQEEEFLLDDTKSDLLKIVREAYDLANKIYANLTNRMVSRSSKDEFIEFLTIANNADKDYDSIEAMTTETKNGDASLLPDEIKELVNLGNAAFNWARSIEQEWL